MCAALARKTAQVRPRCAVARRKLGALRQRSDARIVANDRCPRTMLVRAVLQRVHATSVVAERQPGWAGQCVTPHGRVIGRGGIQDGDGPVRPGRCAVRASSYARSGCASRPCRGLSPATAPCVAHPVARRRAARATERIWWRRSLIGIHGPQQFADPLGIDYRGVASFPGWGQGRMNTAARVALRASSRHGMAEDLTAVLYRPVLGLQRAAALYTAQVRERLRRPDLRDGGLPRQGNRSRSSLRRIRSPWLETQPGGNFEYHSRATAS